MMFLKRASLLGFLLVFSGAGCFSVVPVSQIDQVPVVPASNVTLVSHETTELTDQLRWTRPLTPQIGDNVFLFTLQDSTGRVLASDDLQLVHEKKIHAILVREDLSGFQHLHPEATRDGWTLSTRIPEGGSYHLYLDYIPVGASQMVLHIPFTVPGRGMTKIFPVVPPFRKISVEGITTQLMTMPETLSAGTTTQFTFQLTQREQPVQEIGPYLGAFGHVVILQQGKPNRYVHVHPLTDRQPQDGRVQFETQFSEAGKYMAYAEFNVAGALRVFPFPLEVSSSTNAAPAMPAEHHHH